MAMDNRNLSLSYLKIIPVFFPEPPWIRDLDVCGVEYGGGIVSARFGTGLQGTGLQRRLWCNSNFDRLVLHKEYMCAMIHET